MSYTLQNRKVICASGLYFSLKEESKLASQNIFTSAIQCVYALNESLSIYSASAQHWTKSALIQSLCKFSAVQNSAIIAGDFLGEYCA